jgi:hypothetical protein
MKILGLGLDLRGNPLFAAKEEEQVTNKLVNAIDRNIDEIQRLSTTTTKAVAFRGEVQRQVLDPGDPRQAGWTFLLNKNDPLLNSLKEILRPLAKHRGMENHEDPLLFNDKTTDWFEWLNNNYYALKLEGKKSPQYILIVGTPQQVPFRFQSVLSTVANVGRLDFDSLEDLQTYVDKIIRLEAVPDPVLEREAIFFAPDFGLPDPTYFSREYMAKPLSQHVQNNLKITSHCLFGREATKDNLVSTLRSHKPAIIYTASHGLGAINEPFEVQKRINGGICCQYQNQSGLNSIFTADDVPNGQFLEGSIFFQFACFGYGTPAISDFSHWLDGFTKRNTEADFVAALPKRLLAHPKGPIAYIGHLDMAFLHGFANVQSPHIVDRWHDRIEPFKAAIDNLLGVQPSGFSMLDMNRRYSVCNALITSIYDLQRKGDYTWTTERKRRFLDRWITRNDAQNYMILGDPGASLRIPS